MGPRGVRQAGFLTTSIVVASINGTNVTSGTGVPSGSAGNVGDIYADLSTGEHYEKTGASTWTRIVKAGDAITGTSVNGITFLTGSADPTSGGGVAATAPAYYTRTGTADLYEKTGSGDTAWTRVIKSSDALGGDLSGTLAAATVATVGAKTAAAVAQSVTDTVAATSAATASVLVKRDSSGDAALHSIQLTTPPTIDKVQRPACARYPRSGADFDAIMAAANVALTQADVYEIWTLVGHRWYGWLNGRHLTKGGAGLDSAQLTSIGVVSGLGAGGPDTGVIYGAGNSNSGFAGSSSSIADIAALTAANSLMLITDYACNNTSASYNIFGKGSTGATSPWWLMTLLQGGEMGFYLHDGTHQIAPNSTGLGLRDGKVHHCAWAFRWGQSGNELEMCADGGTPQKTSKSTITGLTTNDVPYAGGVPTISAPAGHHTSYMMLLKGANVDAVGTNTVLNALSMNVVR